MSHTALVMQVLGEKKRILLKLSEEVADCVKCPHLCSTRHQTVFADGNPMSRVMFIGEAPGKDEDRQGKPFVGKSGQLLDNILKACKWERSDVFIANILKCRPPHNRLPESEEIANCAGFLERQIEVVNPEYIVCLGSVASTAIVGLPINQARGKWFAYKGIKVLCTYHPAYLIRNHEAKKMVWDDLQLLLKDMRH
jgi:uracil-DNA glycosylase